MSEIKRFSMSTSNGETVIEFDDDGDWIAYTEHIAVLEAVFKQRDNTHGRYLKALAENVRLRQIISDATSALPNGAFIAPECSVEFMEGLPLEIKLVCAALVSSVAA